MKSRVPKSIVLIVAHPDDETLWAGGTILSHPRNKWFIVSLCRAGDTDRSIRFYRALKLLKSEGTMGNLDDGPDQKPLDEKELQEYIIQLLPSTHFDMIITHGSSGEYTRHLRHEEVSKAVMTLWHNGRISASELWMFAYEDGNKAYYPKAIEKANFYENISRQTWLKKYKIITETYGFDINSWEAQTTPLAEAFWQFKAAHQPNKSFSKSEKELNVFNTPDLEGLKSTYFKSKSFENDRNSWEKEMALLNDAFWHFNRSGHAKKTLHYFKNGLRVSIKKRVKTLKSTYTKSIEYSLNKENWDFRAFSISKAILLLDKTYRKELTHLKVGNELKIFHKPSIEHLKTLYYKTNDYLERQHGQNGQPESI